MGLNILDSEGPQQFYNTELFAQLSPRVPPCFKCVFFFFLAAHLRRLMHLACQDCVVHSGSAANDGWQSAACGSN